MTDEDTLAQAELCVLGCLVLDDSTAGVIFPILKAEDFFYPANRILFDVLERMHNQDKRVDLATLNEQVAKDGVFAEVGGTDYLIQIAEGVPSTANAGYYASVVRNHADARQAGRKG